jgi:hypothetical protein
MGWDRAIEEHYRTNWRCIRRWIIEEGKEELRVARSAIVAAKQRASRQIRQCEASA